MHKTFILNLSLPALYNFALIYHKTHAAIFKIKKAYRHENNKIQNGFKREASNILQI